MRLTGSSNSTPDPFVTVTVNMDWLVPLAVRVEGLARTSTAGGGGEKKPKASMITFTGTALLLKILTAAESTGASAKFGIMAPGVKSISLTPGGLESFTG
jgi:hypothetical protein